MSRDVVIIGAGLAGMSAAVQLSELGHSVKVLEAKPYIGGRTASWQDDGMHIETGLHRFLGVYTELPDILKKVGIDLDDILCWEDEVEIRTASNSAVFALSPLHKPFKSSVSLLGNNDFISIDEKTSISEMFAKAAKDYSNKPEELDSISVLEYAKKCDINKRAIERVLVTLTEGIFFLPIHKYSMFNLMSLVMPYINKIHKLRVGAFTGGMSEVMMKPMAEYVKTRGGTITTNRPIDTLIIDNDTVTGVRAGNQKFKADHVILAASLQGAKNILKKDFSNYQSLQNLFRLPTMPAVTFQMELKRPSMSIDRTTFGPSTSLASFAEQSRTTFHQSEGRLSVILTPPENFINKSAEDTLATVVEEGEKLGLDLKDNILDYRKVNLPHDFYSLGLNNNKLRPPQDIGIKGLTLAGDYTQQQFIATMEGAVVSGKRAAEVVINSVNSDL